MFNNPSQKVVETQDYIRRQNLMRSKSMVARSKQQGNPNAFSQKQSTPQRSNSNVNTSFDLVRATSQVLGHRVAPSSSLAATPIVTPPTVVENIDHDLPNRTEKTVQNMLININELQQRQEDIKIQLLSFRSRLDEFAVKEATPVAAAAVAVPETSNMLLVWATSIGDKNVYSEPTTVKASDADSEIKDKEKVCLQYPLTTTPDADGNYWVKIYRLFQSGKLQSFWTIFQTKEATLFSQFTFASACDNLYNSSTP